MKTLYRKLNRIQALIFVLIFGALGGIYVLATHAESTAGNTIAVQAEVNGVTYNSSYQSLDFTWTNPNGVVLESCSPNVTYGVGSIPGSCIFQQQTGGVIVISVGSSAGNSATFTRWTYQQNGASVSCGDSPASCRVTFSDNGDERVTLTANYSCPAGDTFSASNDTCNAPPPAPAPPTPTPPTPTPSPPSSGSGGTTSGGSSGTTHHTSSSAPSSSSASSGSVSVIPAPSSDTSNETTPSLDDTQPANDGSGTISDTSDLINVPADSTSTVSSSDNLVSVKFPSGTFDTDADCSVDLSTSGSQPPNSSGLIGPYSLDCSDINGNALTTLNNPVTVSVNVPAHRTYVAYVNNTKWTVTNSTAKGQTLSFKLTKTDLFAAATKKSTGWGTIILDGGAVIVFLLVIGGIIRLIRRRQYLDASSSPPPPDYGGDYSTQ